MKISFVSLEVPSLIIGLSFGWYTVKERGRRWRKRDGEEI
jgi:hypothetical protein